MTMRRVWLVLVAWSTVALGGLGCSNGGTQRTGAAGSPGGQGQAGSTGAAGSVGSGGSSSPAGGGGAPDTSGGGGQVSTQGTAGGGSLGGSGVPTGGSGGSNLTGISGSTGSTPDGGAGSPGTVVMDASVSELGANGMIAPGIGQDVPGPAKPTLGMYAGKTARDITFSASSLDPMANSGHQGDNQHGRFDSSKPTKWKLIVLLPGIGGGPGLGTSGWIASQGFHEFDVAYDSAIPGAPNKPDPRATDPATVGNTRMNQFDGKGRTPACSDDNCTANAPLVTRSNSIEQRVLLGIKHLAQLDPMGGWDWYLNADGNSIRWSDCGFFGYSYGATHAAVISVFVRLGLVVVGSGPWNESHPEATWIRTASATPGDRAYAIFGKMDGRYPDYGNETKLLGWGAGPYPFEIPTLTSGPLPAGTATPWYMGSHSLLVDDQGHTEFCAGSNSVCLYSFDHMGQ